MIELKDVSFQYENSDKESVSHIICLWIRESVFFYAAKVDVEKQQ